MSDMQDVAGGQNTAGVATESAQDKRAAAAEVVGHIETAGNGDIRAAAVRLGVRHFENIASLYRYRTPGWQGGAEVGASDGDDGIAGEAEGGAGDCDLKSRGGFRIADQPVGDAESERVHRA